MSDVREDLIDAIGRLLVVGYLDRPKVADAILERFEVTVKPEPPVIGDEMLGVLVASSHNKSTDYAKAGRSFREALESRGLEIVRKEVAE